MRPDLLTAILAVSLCSAPVAFSQSFSVGVASMEGLGASQSAPQTHTLVLPRVDAPRSTAKTQIDPNFILHPPKIRTGNQSSGALVAQNIYPGLRFLPVGNAPTLKAIPTDWPKLKLESIPVTWPNLKLLPVDLPSVAAPAK